MGFEPEGDGAIMLNRVYAVVMAGGKGERFWPQSRISRPKQFLQLLGDATMIEMTVERLRQLLPVENILVVTNREYVDGVRVLMPFLPEENVIGEPAARDTAPCAALAAGIIRARGGDEAVMILLPADHMIERTHDLASLLEDVALRAQTDRIILGGMGLTNDDYLYFKNLFDDAGVSDRIVSFVNTTEAPPVERLLVPDMALTAAEYFAVDKNEKVLVLLTDMTLYADALSIVSNRMDQIPSKDSMPGSLYSDLAKIYEKAVQFPAGGSITIIAVTTLSGGDITHAIPDNTGYITEGQLFLRKDTEIGKVIVDPFRSLSRLKQLVIGKKTRKDHPQVMNAAIRLYADAANARTKMENGFDLTDYDRRTLDFARDYSNSLLAIDVNISTDQMLDTAWKLFRQYFNRSELGIKKEIVDEFGHFEN